MNKRIIGLVLAGLICIGGEVTESYANESLTEKAQVKTEQTRTQNGWVKDENGYWRYYKNGEMLKNQWIKDNEKWYYVDYNGWLITNVHYEIGNKTYLFNANGTMIEKKGWTYLIDEFGCVTWYWGNGDGTVKTNQWIKDNGKWYYVGYEGRLITNGSYEIGNKIYLFDTNGAMIEKKGWTYLIDELGYNWYWGNGDGTVKTNQWIKDNGKWYYVGYYGSMDYGGAHFIDGRYYVFDNSGAMIEKKGLIYVENKYDNSDSWCWGNGDGTVKTEQWIYDNGKWYYADYWGNLRANGSYPIGNKVYVFDSNGAMIEKKGWICFKYEEYDGTYYSDWYYGNGDGTVKTDQWVKDNGKWYYVMGDGWMINDGSLDIDGKEYFFDYNGVCTNK